MYSSLDVSKSPSPCQLLDKAHTFTEDDDLLSPFDTGTGDVERQMKRSWWRTCTLFTFLIATLGILAFIIIRGNSREGGAAGAAAGPNSKLAAAAFNGKDADRSELPSLPTTETLGPRATVHRLFDSSSRVCAGSLIRAMSDGAQLSRETVLMTGIENGFFHLLDAFSSIDLKRRGTVRQYLNIISRIGFFSNALDKDIPLSSIDLNVKSDAIIFVITVNWEQVFGNRLPYVTEKTVTLSYDYKQCEVNAVYENSFKECFNARCVEKDEGDSAVVTYLLEIVGDAKRDGLIK